MWRLQGPGWPKGRDPTLGGVTSGGSRSRRDEEHEVVQDDADADADHDASGPGPPTRQQEEMVVFLSEDSSRDNHYWWDDETMKKYVTWSFTRNLDEGEMFTRWKDASHAQRLKMWRYFTTHVRSVDPGYDPKHEWQRRVTRRITSLLDGLKYNKNKPDWVPQNWWEQLRTREESDPTFAKHSKINAANRRSGSKDGKALGTHTLGRKSCSPMLSVHNFITSLLSSSHILLLIF